MLKFTPSWLTLQFFKPIHVQLPNYSLGIPQKTLIIFMFKVLRQDLLGQMHRIQNLNYGPFLVPQKSMLI
ncbi:hypothetical protein FGO68_gene6874 [Halteria grandinella]|uniref:Uncharacterized protein n=1 Tax=Halteria grandinella TaxID=5974 RepID=A0A8J8N9Y5_HALGN|nr:hypothetical protein FGO68_gene6874 [Halteria grandinella]